MFIRLSIFRSYPSCMMRVLIFSKNTWQFNFSNIYLIEITSIPIYTFLPSHKQYNYLSRVKIRFSTINSRNAFLHFSFSYNQQRHIFWSCLTTVYYRIISIFREMFLIGSVLWAKGKYWTCFVLSALSLCGTHFPSIFGFLVAFRWYTTLPWSKRLQKGPRLGS